ncbi:MAG: UDP-glucose 4-epimerase GalE [Christensenellales bacterium]|jgi:UDP-glucose 4-epimerase
MGKILLTGGAGYIGAHTCVALLDAGYEIVVVDNYANSSEEALRRVIEITGKPFSYYEADVCDRGAMDEIFKNESIGAAIHFAGYKAVGESVAKPAMYYRNNIDAALTLFETMEKHGVKRVLFSSSATVYGTDAGADCREDQRLTFSTSNPYGSTKFMIERILRDISVARPDWSIALLRYFNPAGAHESGRIGEDPNGIPNNLMPRVMRAASGRMEKLGVFGDDYPTPDGTCRRDYIHVCDLARGHVAALDYIIKHKGCEVVNLGTGVPYSVLEIIRTFMRVTGTEFSYGVTARRPGDLPEAYANVEKAKELFGWQAEKTLEDMCRDAWRWQIMNPNGYASR